MVIYSAPLEPIEFYPMADWVHCNACYVMPAKGVEYNLTTCGHIYCQKCVVQSTKEGCRLCNAKCTTISLSGKMKPDVEAFFRDPSVQLHQAFKKFKQILEFQKSHRDRLVNYRAKKLAEQTKVMVEARKMFNAQQAMQRENKKLKDENCYLKTLLQEKGSGSGQRPRFGSSPNRGSPISPGKHLTGGGGNRQYVSSNTSRSQYRGPSPMPGRNPSGFASPSEGTITPERVLAMTPPTHSRLGQIDSPSGRRMTYPRTPDSVPHNILNTPCTPDSQFGY